MAFRSKPFWSIAFGDTTDYVRIGAWLLAAVLLAIFAGRPSLWPALIAGVAITALIVWYRGKPRRSHDRENQNRHHG
jgi:hypothetical protein